MMRGIPADSIIHYSVEPIGAEGEGTKRYRQEGTYTTSDGVDRYFEDTFDVDRSGFLIRKDSSIGLFSSKELTMRRKESYELNPKGLKITAPIR